MLMKKNYFVPKMNIFQYQVSICKKIIRCFRLSKEHPEYFCDPYHFFMLSKVEQDTYLDYDIETECHKMFMFNYLIVLLGYKKNDKISIINHPIHGKETIGRDFIKENKKLIDNLYVIRDKVYSHFDIDFLDYAQVVTFNDIEKCINFLKKYLEL